MVDSPLKQVYDSRNHQETNGNERENKKNPDTKKTSSIDSKKRPENSRPMVPDLEETQSKNNDKKKNQQNGEIQPQKNKNPDVAKSDDHAKNTGMNNKQGSRVLNTEHKPLLEYERPTGSGRQTKQNEDILSNDLRETTNRGRNNKKTEATNAFSSANHGNGQQKPSNPIDGFLSNVMVGAGKGIGKFLEMTGENTGEFVGSKLDAASVASRLAKVGANLALDAASNTQVRPGINKDLSNHNNTIKIQTNATTQTPKTISESGVDMHTTITSPLLHNLGNGPETLDPIPRAKANETATVIINPSPMPFTKHLKPELIDKSITDTATNINITDTEFNDNAGNGNKANTTELFLKTNAHLPSNGIVLPNNASQNIEEQESLTSEIVKRDSGNDIRHVITPFTLNTSSTNHTHHLQQDPYPLQPNQISTTNKMSEDNSNENKIPLGDSKMTLTLSKNKSGYNTSDNQNGENKANQFIDDDESDFLPIVRVNQSQNTQNLGMSRITGQDTPINLIPDQQEDGFEQKSFDSSIENDFKFNTDVQNEENTLRGANIPNLGSSDIENRRKLFYNKARKLPPDNTSSEGSSAQSSGISDPIVITNDQNQTISQSSRLDNSMNAYVVDSANTQHRVIGSVIGLPEKADSNINQGNIESPNSDLSAENLRINATAINSQNKPSGTIVESEQSRETHTPDVSARSGKKNHVTVDGSENEIISKASEAANINIPSETTNYMHNVKYEHISRGDPATNRIMRRPAATTESASDSDETNDVYRVFHNRWSRNRP